MRSEDFSAWLAAIGGLRAQQRREALRALAATNGEERDSTTGDLAKEGGKRRSRGKDALGTTSHERIEAQGLSPLRGPRDRRLGPLARTFAVSLHELRAHVQRADQDPNGASAQEGPLARSRQSDDRRQELGEDRGALRRSSADGVSLAIGFCAPRFRQAAKLKRDRRSGRNLRP